MLHHVSFTAKHPRRAAEAIARLINGRVSRFGPWEGGYIAWAPDQAGTAIEIYPHGTELVPGEGHAHARFQKNLFAAKATAAHAAISVELDAEEVFGIVKAEGWRAAVQDRGGFNIIEAWIEDTVMLEILTPAMTKQYLAVVKSPQVAVGGTDVQSLEVTAEIATDPATLFAAWTDSTAMTAWWAIPAATIDLRVGGIYELLFQPEAPAGSRGSEQCKILSYVPDRLLSFTWNTPVHLGLAAAQTWVVLEFVATEIGTELRLTHCGFGAGADWDHAKTYFAKAWRRVLHRLATHWPEHEVDLRAAAATAPTEPVAARTPRQRDPRTDNTTVATKLPKPNGYATTPV
jgi:uncharacterized protein YndB with AHSA1/START domain